MKLCLKITAGLLLLVQAFSLASLQNTTDSPGRTIDGKWLREFAKKLAASQNIALSEEKGFDQENDGTPMESSNDYSGIASGSMAVFNEEEENVASQDEGANESDDMRFFTTTTMPLDVTTEQPEFQNTTVSPTTATTDQTNSSDVNMIDAEEDFYNSTMTPQNSTTLPSVQNATSFPDYSNQTDLNTTTLSPEINTTQESTTKLEEYPWFSNVTESTNTTNVTTTVTTTPTTVTPEITNTPTVLLTTTPSDSWTTAINPETSTTTLAAMNTSERGNDTDKAGASVSDSERGLASDTNTQKHSTWGTVLGIVAVMVCVGLVAYVILKHKHQKGFSHRKLVEEFPSDPVLRLDNSEPLDLNFGGSAYYNPALQGDNIQMSNFPGRR
ncbi:mucin-15 [Labrus mixtus]|uniref:mucin-15 n=1 Tax=Labrus mixtus TaxID=508554 RepID=UPI0029C0EAB0|nr:mucin-15 [Labrus mixtus]